MLELGLSRWKIIDSDARVWDLTSRWQSLQAVAIVLDVHSRRVAGWAMETRLQTELIRSALEMALVRRRPQSVIHHSDRGCQYTSYAFGKRCQEAGVMPSMGSVDGRYTAAAAWPTARY